MKRIYYITALALLLMSLCACNDSSNTTATNNFSDEMVIEDSGNFSTEMFIEASTDVIIVEME